jgi:multiple sugar transport system substrate-binding protein
MISQEEESIAMNRSRSGPRHLLAFVGIVAILAAACGSATSSAPASTAPSAAAPSQSLVAVTPEPIAADQPGPNGGVVVRWFVGLGTGGQPQQLEAERKVVDDYNNSQKDVYISLEIYDNKVAPGILKTQIAAGNPPDIIGPVGVEGLNLFRDQILDLAPLVASTGYDTSKVDPSLVDFFKMGQGNAQIGLPFATYPSFLYYNKALFDEAGLPYPPTKVGDKYQGKDWDMNAVRDIAMKLTVDKNGNDATSADFDPANIVQWGFDMQWTDNSPLAESSLFGASSLVADDGKTAQIQDSLRAGQEWFYNGIWKDHFIPTKAAVDSDLLAKGNEFQSGNLAMDESHSWYTCCINPAAPAAPIVKDFGFAVAPAHDGKTTAKLHADTFSLLKTTKHPDQAFKAMTVLLDSAALITAYGAFPADPAKQQAFFDSVNKQYPAVTLDWSVPKAMLSYPDIPNHQSWTPDYAKTKAALQAFQNKARTTQGLDIDAELDTLKTTLQGIFDAAPDAGS